EAAYFHVVTPAGDGWKVRLGADAGEVMLSVAKGVLPNIFPGFDASGGSTSGQRVQKTGDEQFAELPPPRAPGCPATDYYLAVISEGMNPVGDRIGTNTSSFTLTNGPLSVNPVGGGTVNLAGPDLTTTDSLEGGELKGYRFDVPPGVPSLEV